MSHTTCITHPSILGAHAVTRMLTSTIEDSKSQNNIIYLLLHAESTQSTMTLFLHFFFFFCPAFFSRDFFYSESILLLTWLTRSCFSRIPKLLTVKPANPLNICRYLLNKIFIFRKLGVPIPFRFWPAVFTMNFME